MRIYRCGDYLRLSKEDLLKRKNDESSSIEAQRMIIESFCNYHKLELVEEYVDDGYSGGNFDRPAFQRMIDDIENGKINCVITKDFSRLGRELYQTGSYIEDYFAEKGVRYIAINDSYDSLDGDDTISMKLTYNDYTLRQTSRKIKSTFDIKRENGLYIGSIPKYGYLKDPRDHNHLIVDPVASQIVKRIYDMALNGNSCYKIANVLTDERIPIPIVYKKEKRGQSVTDNDGYGIWRQQTIRDILHSEMYIGNMVQNQYYKVRYNSKKLRANKKEDYIIVPNTHEPIIDKKIFKQVQEILEKNKRVAINDTEDSEDNIHLFTGLLKCKECGHRISILKKKNKKNNSHYTQCCQYSKKGRYGVCNSHRLNYNWLEEDLIQIINGIGHGFLKEYDNQLLTDEANAILKEDLSNIEKQIDYYTKESTKFNTAIEHLYMDRIESKIPEDIYSNLLAKYNNDLNINFTKKKELEEERELISSKVSNLDYESCAKIVREFINSKQITRSLILELVDKIEIDNDKNIKIHFRFNELSIYAH